MNNYIQAFFIRSVEPQYQVDKEKTYDFDSPVFLPVRKSRTSDAMLLTASRAVDLQTKDWQTSLTGRHSQPITISHFAPQVLAVGADASGNYLTWAEHSKPYLYPTHKSAVDAAENNLSLLIEPAISAWQCPFFITSIANAKPARCTAIVELNFSHYDELPDVQGIIAFHKNYAEKINSTNLKTVNKFIHLVQRLSPRPGEYFPACVAHEGKDVPCVIYLAQRYGNLLQQRRRQYEAHIYLSNTALVISGTEFYREVTWQNFDSSSTRKTVICTALSIT